SQLISTYVGPAFTMRSGDLHIWAPVAFEAEARELKRGEEMYLQLEPFEEKTFEYNLAKIRWDSVYSSVWPTRLFSSVAVPGIYTLMFEIRKRTGSATERFESNAIEITLLPKVSFEKSKFLAGEENSGVIQ
ncbi:MAG: hypothetical protein PHQ96_05305, partial [Candidatus Omnitrophica bacterium]|nr:hypothetical protein [Candidatus Omnitrophota bacterium]